jgi:hypothetical protein
MMPTRLVENGRRQRGNGGGEVGGRQRGVEGAPGVDIDRAAVLPLAGRGGRHVHLPGGWAVGGLEIGRLGVVRLGGWENVGGGLVCRGAVGWLGWASFFVFDFLELIPPLFWPTGWAGAGWTGLGRLGLVSCPTTATPSCPWERSPRLPHPATRASTTHAHLERGLPKAPAP